MSLGFHSWKTTYIFMFVHRPNVCIDKNEPSTVKCRLVYQLKVRLDHEMPFGDLSKKTHDAYMSRWCNLQVDVLEVGGVNMEKVEERVKESLKMLTKAEKEETPLVLDYYI